MQFEMKAMLKQERRNVSFLIELRIK
jgi:hypothetical protein